MEVVSNERFTSLLVESLGDNFLRAEEIFNNYGPMRSYDVSTVLLHAVDKGKTEEIISALEKHWDEELKDQHPDWRGKSEKTQQFFIHLRDDVLQIEPQ